MRSVKSLHQTKKKHTGFDLFEAKDEIFLAVQDSSIGDIVTE